MLFNNFYFFIPNCNIFSVLSIFKCKQTISLVLLNNFYFFVPNCNIFSVLSIFKCKQTISLFLLNNFYFFAPNCNIFSVLSIFKNEQTISLLLLNNFYPVTSYRWVQKGKESDESLYTIRSLVMVRNQLPVQVNAQRPFSSVTLSNI